MKKVQLIKSNQIFLGIALLAAAIFFGFLLLLAITTEDAFSARLLFATLFIAVLIDVAISWIKKSTEIDVPKLGIEEKNIWVTIARVIGYFDFIKKIILLGVILTLLGFFVFDGIKKWSANEIHFSLNFLIMVAVYFFYFFILRKFLIFVGKEITNRAKRYSPTYKLYKDSIEIDLNIKNRENKKFLVKIYFREISEIKVFSYIEAKTFLRYSVGPNVELLVRKTKELFQYMKGEIKRPSVYIVSPVSELSNVLIKGKELFYLLPFDKENVNDFITKYKNLKG